MHRNAGNGGLVGCPTAPKRPGTEGRPGRTLFVHLSGAFGAGEIDLRADPKLPFLVGGKKTI